MNEETSDSYETRIKEEVKFLLYFYRVISLQGIKIDNLRYHELKSNNLNPRTLF